MQLMTVTTKGQVTIPQDIRFFLGLKSGDKVVFEKNFNAIEIRSVPSFFSYRGVLKGSRRIGEKSIKAEVARRLAGRYTKTVLN